MGQSESLVSRGHLFGGGEIPVTLGFLTLNPSIPVLPINTQTITFDAVAQDPISLGASNSPAVQNTANGSAAVDADTAACESTLTSLLNPAFRGKSVWQALVAGIAKGDCNVRTQAELAFDQLTIATASGVYLQRRAGDSGVTKPSLTGMVDDLFRKLTVSVVNFKLTQSAFLRILDTLYGPDAVRGFIETGLDEPYVLFDGATLDMLVDETVKATAIFNREDFAILRRAQAVEVAAVINRALESVQSNAWAEVHINPLTGGKRVRIYSGSRGLHSAMRITSGTAAIALQPPTNLFPPPNPMPGLPDWTITILPGGRARYQASDDGVYNLGRVVPGDYFTLLGSEFAAGNRGTFVVDNVSFSFVGAVLVQFVETTNPAAVNQTVTQADYTSLEFFRATKRTQYDTPTYAIVAQADGKATVSIAATTQAVNRHIGTGAYLHAAPSFEVASVARNPFGLATIATSLPHGLVPGQTFFLDGLLPDTTIPFPVGENTSNAFSGTDDASGTTGSDPISAWRPDFTFEGADYKTLRDLDGDLWILGGNKYNSSGGAITPLNTAATFRVQSETEDGNGAVSTVYEWTRGPMGSDYNLGTAPVVLDDSLHYNSIRLVGGYVNTPWGAPVGSDPLVGTVGVLAKLLATPWQTASATGGTIISTAEATATWLRASSKILVAGGVDTYNRPQATIQEGLDTWSTMPVGLNQPRCSHAAVKLDDTHVMVIGGRQPASNIARALLFGFTSWDFEEPAGAVTFNGPVMITDSGNSRLAGKLGYGLNLASATSTSTGGGAQTSLNTLLLGDWTITGWMTAGLGCVLRNGVVTWAAQADNTLISFGVDPADDKFFVRWNAGPILNTFIKKTAQTRTVLMGATRGAPFPRYHHYAITKAISGANATFTLYINGAQAGQWTDTKPDGGSNGLWSFGQADTGVARFTGCIDAIGITGSALTFDKISRIFLDEVGVVYDNPGDALASPVGKVLNTCEIVPHNASSLNPPVFTGPMTYARFAAAVVPLPDGRIVVAGGVGYNPSTDQFPYNKAQREIELKSAEIYDPRLKIWTPLPDMREAHSYPAAGYVAAENRIYVAGGFTSRSTEYLDLATMKWGVSSASFPLIGEKSKGGGGLAGGRTMVLAGGAILNTTDNPRPVYDTSTRGPLDYIMPVAAEALYAGGLDGLLVAGDGTSGSTIVVETPGRAYTTSAAPMGVTVSAASAPAGGAPGPYIFDPKGGFGITATTAMLANRLEAGRRYGSLQLGSGQALNIPDAPGYVVVAFGRSNQVGPVKYLGRLTADSLILDAGFRWPTTVEAGAEVRLLLGRSPFVPDNPESIGSFYLTAAFAGRLAAEDLLRQISATGIDLDIEVRYPGDFGLGGAGFPVHGSQKLSDITAVFGGNELDSELAALKEE
jgi:Concanavalin A-like lectin/glucanases superfamily/Kelch motif